MDEFAHEQEPRATGSDWAKAFLCSILLILLLLLLFWPFPDGTGLGGRGMGISGTGVGEGDRNGEGVGDGEGSGVGAGSGTGMDSAGEGSGAESSGSAGGADADGSVRGSNADSGGDSISPPTEEPDEEAVGKTSAGEDESAADVKDPEEPGDEEKTAPVETEPPPEPLTIATISANKATPNGIAPPPFMGARGDKGQSGGKDVGGMIIRGGALGVVLDVSGSMFPYLVELRKEIEEKFPDAIFLEVSGCAIDESRFDPETFKNSKIWEGNNRRSVMDAMRELVEYHGVDSVYWFCDLQDRQTPDGLDQLHKLVWGRYKNGDKFNLPSNGSESPKTSGQAFRLYVRSLDQSPNEKLSEIIKDSGGQFQLKKGQASRPSSRGFPFR